MDEIVFVVSEEAEGGFSARAVGASIFTDADDLASLRAGVRDAVRCHFEEESRPQAIRLEFAWGDALGECIQLGLPSFGRWRRTRGR
ncbi:MAG: 2-oxoisovalerate dehydrogenase [Dehalococcoidia bacterium]